uniref:Basic helix-loop-helix regulatory family protein n=1 Tax=Rhizophora mucronata TaxID=61149 RepID=A0A2P2IKI5_RHIMU
MANIVQSQDEVLVNLRKRLAVAVRSIQWSYAIFWSMSTTQQGPLDWVDGYYNGDTKTRKTTNGLEVKCNKMGLERSEQLRELYKSLLEDETDQEAKRHSVALSPEDLTDAEWYYMVCMSFVFNPGQGLPGRALAERQIIWLCNAQYADSKTFSRSLLAKSASIQTVVCFPHFGGVIELGTTELVTEDPGLIQHIKASLLDISKPVCSEKSSCAHYNDDDKDPMCAKVNHETIDTLHLVELHNPTEDTKFDPEGINGNIHGTFNLDPADNCSYGCGHNHQTEDSCMLQRLSGGDSQVQSWHFMDDEFRNASQVSMNSSDCVSEAIMKHEKVFPASNGKNVIHVQLKELQECNHTKLSSLGLGDDEDLHYKRTVSLVLRSSNQFVENLCSGRGNYKSSFVSWKNGVDGGYKPQVQQNMVKKILFAAPLMHTGRSLKPEIGNGGKDCLGKLERHEVGKMYISDRQEENEKFCILRSKIPCIREIDQASILSVTIKYVKMLEERIEELESCMGSADYEARPRRNDLDMVERTSDNCHKRTYNSVTPWINKRKDYEHNIDETDCPELNGVAPTNGLDLDVKVSMKQKEILIQIRCPYREYILLEIMDEINKLHLDVLSIQSSSLDGTLISTLKAKFRVAQVAPAEMIKQALWKIACKS